MTSVVKGGHPALLPLPRYQGKDPQLAAYLNQLVLTLEQRLYERSTPAGQTVYTTSNVTQSRTLDPTLATLLSLAEVVATMIIDLQAQGSLGA